MAARLSLAFLAGASSFLAPCVLPLVPGYLSAIAAVEASALGQPRIGRRVFIASVPFVIGFTSVFTLFGAGAALAGNYLSPNSIRLQPIAGFFLVVLGLGFAGLLPFPERSVAPGLLGHALRGGSGLMFGAAFAISASPCVGPVLGATLVLAGSTRTATEGAVLLLFYSLGLALPFVATGIAFARVIGPLRWLRDRFAIARSAGGGSLVALGALIFFGRFWWLNVLVSRALSVVGLQ